MNEQYIGSNFLRLAISRWLGWLTTMLWCVGSLAANPQRSEASTQGATLFERLRPAVFTLRTLPADARGATTANDPEALGSAFLVDAGGRAVTAYHVISAQARQPARHRLEAVMAGGQTRAVHVLAIDVVADLALLQIQGVDRWPVWVTVPATPARERIGSPIHAMGNPSGLGITVMPGHFSGHVNSPGSSRIHFSGTLNPGMSGGPAVTDDGSLVGVNVSRRRYAQQIGFLVPAQAVRALMDARRSPGPLDQVGINREIERQVLDFHTRLRDASVAQAAPKFSIGPYRVAQAIMAGLPCSSSPAISAGDGDGKEDSEARQRQMRGCEMENSINADSNTPVGYASVDFVYYRAGPLNRIQFNRWVEQESLPSLWVREDDDMIKPACVDRLTMGGTAVTMPIRLVFCAQQRKDFPRLYNVQLAVISRDRPDEAMTARMTLRGVDRHTAATYVRLLAAAIE